HFGNLAPAGRSSPPSWRNTPTAPHKRAKTGCIRRVRGDCPLARPVLKRRAMTKLARFISLLVGVSVCLWGAPAEAQTITLPNTAFEIERENPRSDAERPLDISRQDCLDAAPFGWDTNRGTE